MGMLLRGKNYEKGDAFKGGEGLNLQGLPDEDLKTFVHSNFFIKFILFFFFFKFRYLINWFKKFVCFFILIKSRANGCF